MNLTCQCGAPTFESDMDCNRVPKLIEEEGQGGEQI
jgi:hypothetical protein